MSANSTVQHISTGFGAYIGGKILKKGADGTLLYFNRVGLIAVAATLVSLWLAGRVIGLTDAEKDRLQGELEAILDHIARLQQVDTSTLAETAQVGDLVNVMRADETEEPIGAAAALRNAPASDGNYFVVGAIQGVELDA